MSKTLGRVLIAAGLAVASASSAFAGKLPATAVPMTAEDVTKLHSGNTGLYPTVDEYFAPDGTTIGIFGKPVAKSTFSGKWIVFGHTLCTLNGNKFETKIYVDCNAFWRDGDKILVLWATRSDGAKADTLNGYFEATNATKPGNLVGDRYRAAGGL